MSNTSIFFPGKVQTIGFFEEPGGQFKSLVGGIKGRCMSSWDEQHTAFSLTTRCDQPSKHREEHWQHFKSECGQQFELLSGVDPSSEVFHQPRPPYSIETTLVPNPFNAYDFSPAWAIKSRDDTGPVISSPSYIPSEHTVKKQSHITLTDDAEISVAKLQWEMKDHFKAGLTVMWKSSPLYAQQSQSGEKSPSDLECIIAGTSVVQNARYAFYDAFYDITHGPKDVELETTIGYDPSATDRANSFSCQWSLRGAVHDQSADSHSASEASFYGSDVHRPPLIASYGGTWSKKR